MHQEETIAVDALTPSRTACAKKKVTENEKIEKTDCVYYLSKRLLSSIYF